MYTRSPRTISQLRREVVGDSVERQKALTKLLALVREEERNKVIATMTKARDRAEAERA